jgi:hypothetical protein
MKLGKYEIPKRAVRDTSKLACVPQMIALLSCYKANNFQAGKCVAEEQGLSTCAKGKVTSSMTLQSPS